MIFYKYFIRRWTNILFVFQFNWKCFELYLTFSKTKVNLYCEMMNFCVFTFRLLKSYRDLLEIFHFLIFWIIRLGEYRRGIYSYQSNFIWQREIFCMRFIENWNTIRNGVNKDTRWRVFLGVRRIAIKWNKSRTIF